MENVLRVIDLVAQVTLLVFLLSMFISNERRFSRIEKGIRVLEKWRNRK